jgi:hypothetical protein
MEDALWIQDLSGEYINQSGSSLKQEFSCMEHKKGGSLHT